MKNEAVANATAALIPRQESGACRGCGVKYEWRETLCRKGIIRCGQEGRNRLWDEGEYAPFPPGYRGN